MNICYNQHLVSKNDDLYLISFETNSWSIGTVCIDLQSHIFYKWKLVIITDKNFCLVFWFCAYNFEVLCIIQQSNDNDLIWMSGIREIEHVENRLRTDLKDVSGTFFCYSNTFAIFCGIKLMPKLFSRAYPFPARIIILKLKLWFKCPRVISML